MTLRLPRRAWPLWFTGGVLWFGMAVPFLLYPGHYLPVFVWRASGTVAVLLSILSIVLSGFVSLVTIGALAEAPIPTWTSAGFGAAWLVYLQLLRAAALHRASAWRDARRLRDSFA